MQAQKCEEFHYKNDYKLNIMSSFFNDHVVKHLNEYESCWKNAEFENLKTNEEKDRSFLDCHNRWVRNMRENISQELEVRVRELFQKSD